MTKTTFNRAELVRIANLVKPALASTPHIPALVHICFDGESAEAYNDVAAIRVRADLGVKRLIPGDLLIRALGGLGAESIVFSQGDDDALVLKSGRSTVKLPTLPLDKFPLRWPSEKPYQVELTDSMLRGIERCLLSVGKDPKRPAHMGVTLDFNDDGCAVLYSTDNVTISRFQTEDEVKLPGDAPVILPKFFCEQLVVLSKAFPEAARTLLLRDGSIEATFGEDDAALLTRTPVDMQPMDFPTVFEKHCPAKWLGKAMFPIPDGLDGALARALLILASDPNPVTELKVTGTSDMTLVSGGNDGQSDDDLDAGDFNIGITGTFKVDPAKLARGAKVTSLMGISQKVTVLASSDSDFVHIIAHVS